jgi:hypothetical protein
LDRRNKLKNQLLITLFIFFVGSNVFADNQSDYYKYMELKDYEKALLSLKSWEKEDIHNPEMYVGYINYYIFRSRKDGFSIDEINKSKKDQSQSKLTFTDPKTGKTYFFNSKYFYNLNDVNSALIYLNKGIKEYPNRLDLLFGKVYILNEIDNFHEAALCLIKYLTTSVEINNNWLWSNNKPMNEGYEFFLEQIQDYYSIWISDRSQSALDAVKLVAEKQIELYPKHSWAYDNLALYYSFTNNPQKQLELLLKSELISPTDPVTLNNIGNWYKMNNNKEKAKIYYQKLYATGDPSAIEEAKKNLEILK